MSPLGPHYHPGSPLRLWLRRERARENAEFMKAMRAKVGESIPPVYPTVVVEALWETVPFDPSAKSITLRLPPPVLLFANPILPEDFSGWDPGHAPLEPDGDGDLTAYPRVPRPTR